jgi:hypothetical protein
MLTFLLSVTYATCTLDQYWPSNCSSVVVELQSCDPKDSAALGTTEVEYQETPDNGFAPH